MRRARRLSHLWRTAAFRLAIIFATIFGIGAAAMLLLLDFGIARFAEDELRNALRHQMAIMRTDAQLEGSAALARILTEHVRTDRINRYRYLIIPRDGPTFNSGIPESAVRIEGFGIIEAITGDAPPGRPPRRVDMQVLTERAADGTFMAVGRENYPLDDLRTGLHRFALWGSIALILLAATAGAIVGIVFLRRLELVNATTGRIIDGNLSERLPAIGFGSEFHDLTCNLNAMLDRLERAMAAMRQMSSDVAHDLRQPLTRLRNQLEELNPGSDAQAAQIEEAIEEADELLAMFNAMLRLAQLEGGNLRYGMIAVDLSKLMELVAEVYRPAAEVEGRMLLASVSPASPVMGDPTLLNQLLANLIDNALYHTAVGTKVEIGLESTPDSVVLIVQDDGPGVPEADLPLLTRRLYRVDSSRTRPGTGLGLTLVAAIVELHKGTMRIVNSKPGLRVEIAFPRAEATECAFDRHHAQSPMEHPPTGQALPGI